MAFGAANLQMNAIKMGWRKRAFPALAGLTVLMAAAAWMLFFPYALSNFGNQLFDEFQRRNPREYADMGVRVIDIDEESIERLGQWPWPRTLIGEMTENLFNAGAGVVAYDVVFSEPDRTSPENVVPVLQAAGAPEELLVSLENAKSHDAQLGEMFAQLPVILGFFMEKSPKDEVPLGCGAGMTIFGDDPSGVLPAYGSATQSLPTIRKNASGAGFLSVVPKTAGDDRYVRTAPMLATVNGTICPSLSLSVLKFISGAGSYRLETSTKSGEFGANVSEMVGVRVGDFFVPTTGDGQLFMNYTASNENRVIPAWKLLDPSVSEAERREWLDGTIVFVGAGAQGLNDLVATPINPEVPGVLIHAQAVEMAITSAFTDAQVFLQKPEWSNGLRLAALVLGGLVLILVVPITGPIIGGLAGVLMVGGMVFSSYFLYTERQLLFDPVFPVLGLLSVYGVTSLFSFVVSEAEKSHIRDAFDHYLSPELVEKIADDPSRLRLGGEERDMTILFSDIRSFSKISETMTPPELTNFLNRYLTPMTDILMDHKATVDKYIGDAVMSFWNAPLDDPDQYANAARSALEMMVKLEEMNAKVGMEVDEDEDSLPVKTKIGIGLHSGPTSVGNMGSEQRFAYSVLGDTVNTASRLEGMTKQYGIGILLGDALAAHLEHFAVVEVDRAKAVGKDSWLAIFALVGDESVAADPAFGQLKATQGEFLEKYRAQKFDEALTIADELAILGERFGLSAHYAIMKERIEYFRTNPPPKDWDGVYVLQEK